MFGDPGAPVDALAIVEHFQMEFYNGGLSQFFANWEPADAALVPHALRVIGCPQIAVIMDEAVAAMGPQNGWQDLGHDALMQPDAAITATLYGFCDRLDAEDDTLKKAVTDFEYRLAKVSGKEMFE